MFQLFLIIIFAVATVWLAKRAISLAMEISEESKAKNPNQAEIERLAKEIEATRIKAATETLSWEERDRYHDNTKRIEQLKNKKPKSREFYEKPIFFYALSGFTGFVTLVILVSTSLVFVKENTTAHFTRVWGGNELAAGEIISRKEMSITSGGKGPQSQTLRPGTYFMLLQNVLYDRASSEMEKMLNVPAGQFAVLVAKDGIPMTGDRMLAPEWEASKFTSMLEDAHYFLNNNGMKGMQYTVVPSGSYHINNYLWQVVGFFKETKVTTGEVAVIRSNIQLDPNQDCTPIDKTTKVPLVPKGCRGVWDVELEQGTYRFNPHAITPTVISVRQNTNDHVGNYKRMLISFSTDKEGNIVPSLKPETVEQGDAIDDAIDIRAEGWNIDQDVSTFWQIEDAPKAVAQLGDQEKIAQFVSRVTQSEFRIVAQGKDSSLCVEKSPEYKECMAEARQAMDLIYKRAEIEAQARDAIHAEIQHYGVDLNKVTMGRPNIPPELLMPALRTQYAEKMRNTLQEEERTAQKRIAVQNANELANNQAILVTADLQDQAAAKEAARIIKLAEARKSAALKEADGQKALLNVMGAEKVQEQILTQKVLDLIKDCPECVKVPEVLVQGGDSSGLEGFGAILGHSNVKAAIASRKED